MPENQDLYSEELEDSKTQTPPEDEQEKKDIPPFVVEYPDNYKLIPLGVMLVAGLAVSVACFIVHYELIPSLWILVAVLFAFYIAGRKIRKTVEKFWYDNAYKEYQEQYPEVSEEGEVIQKEPDKDTENEE